MREASYYFSVLLSYLIFSQITIFFKTNNIICWVILRFVFWGGAIAIFLLCSFVLKEKLLRWWKSLSKQTCLIINVILLLITLTEMTSYLLIKFLK